MLYCHMRFFTLLILSFCILACQEPDKNLHLLNDISPDLDGPWVNVVIEISAGSTEKWEVNKVTGQIERDSLNGQPRTIQYLGYPGNYGFIPQTLLSKEAGGDGDPLDVLVIGESVDRGTILRCKVLGALKLLDHNEKDDKLIALSETSHIKVANLAELDTQYTGILEVIETWFENYKGKGIVITQGFDSESMAIGTIEEAITAFKD